jgi:hypothetical protein
MSRCVNELDFDFTEAQPIPAVVEREVGIGYPCHEADALGLRFLNVHLHALQFEESSEPLDIVTEEITADVIGMIVGGEGADQLHVVLFGGVDEILDVPSRIHHDGLPGRAIPDEVAEVDHLSGNRIPTGEVPPGKELAKV